MAIRKKEEVKEPQLPIALLEPATTALWFQVARDYFDKRYSDMKGPFFAAVERSAEIELVEGKSFKFAHGIFRWQSRKKQNVNMDVIVQAVNDKRLPVESLLACVSTFNAEALNALLPDAVAFAPGTSFGVMQGTPEFKAHVTESLEVLLEQHPISRIVEPVAI